MDIEQALEQALQHHRAKQLPQAESLYRQILQVDPNQTNALHLLGVIAYQVEQYDVAVELINKALATKPDYVEALNNLGRALQAQGHLNAAAASYRKALTLDCEFIAAHSGLGTILQAQGALDEATNCYQTALSINPNYAEAHNNIGTIHRHQRRLHAAVASYENALSIKPDYALALSNLGAALLALGKPEQAMASLEKAILIEPQQAEARSSLGRAQLLLGDFLAGWDNYAWRRKEKNPATRPPDYEEPLWDGRTLEGKTIFIHPEQGLGDVIQFARYVPLVKAFGGQVFFKVYQSLFRLFQGMQGSDGLLEPDAPLPPFDFHASFLDLPRILQTKLETIPSGVGYLTAEPHLVKKWESRIGGASFKIGIAWQGNPEGQVDHGRSPPLAHFSNIAADARYRLISLQKNYGLDQIEALRPEMAIETWDNTDKDGAFIDTAAMMMSLDLIITSDTAVAHLAGALGRPVWVVLQFAPDWRWMLNRNDSPWYPSMRLFRQQKAGAWAGVFDELKRALDTEF
ncbi:MAG: tetratricopeptide repeat protein [Chromatiales bacterium]|jgi:tetratricopeptide (TPR) repeat protein|nr:tetratricopeptide repeat protein [Chromatiales bacterium]